MGRERQWEMTLEEASRISAQHETGALDTTLPGTRKLIDQAHRVQFDAQLWGAPRNDTRRRRLHRAILLGGLFVAASLLGFSASFALASVS